MNTSTIHDHDGDVCSLCPSEDQMEQMRARNTEAETARREELLAAIAADASAYVHVVQGYQDADDGDPEIMFVSSTLEKAADYCHDALRFDNDAVYEIRPHKLDDDLSSNGTVVVAHFMRVDGEPTEIVGQLMG